MRNLFSKLQLILMALIMMACQSEEADAMPISNNNQSSTLIVYYSYTNNTEAIVTDLHNLITADVIEVEPAEKGLDYAANNYALGTEQLNKINANPNDENSYPAIDPVDVDMSKYSTVIIATPLWWSQMASNMQTFLFKYGKQMADKNIGLIVSSHSSGISGVESNAHRLVPDGKFLSKSLWINASNFSQRTSLLEKWLKDVDYDNLPTNTSSNMYLTVNEQTLKVNLADNDATKALVAKLNASPITYTANDYGGFEKVGALGFSLPSNDTSIATEVGDIMLYNSNQLCIFFGSNSWAYTRIGKIDGMSSQQLKDIFGNGQVSITLSLNDSAGIDAITENHTKQNSIYSLEGLKLAEVPTKGMYIENGVKKVK